MATAEIVQFKKQYESKFVCTACGADRDCDCKAPAMRRKRVEEYFENNPTASERQAATDLGLPKSTVHDMVSTGARLRAPETVTGKDGKQYPTRKSRDEGKDDDASAEALANFRAACNQWLPRLNEEDTRAAIECVRNKTGYF